MVVRLPRAGGRPSGLRGGPAVEGTRVERGRSRAGMPYASRPAEGGWVIPAPSPASNRASLRPSPILPYVVRPRLRSLTRSAARTCRHNQAAARRRSSCCFFSVVLPESEDPSSTKMSNCLNRCGHSASSFESPAMGYLGRRGPSRIFFIDFDPFQGRYLFSVQGRSDTEKSKSGVP